MVERLQRIAARHIYCAASHLLVALFYRVSNSKRTAASEITAAHYGQITRAASRHLEFRDHAGCEYCLARELIAPAQRVCCKIA